MPVEESTKKTFQFDPTVPGGFAEIPEPVVQAQSPPVTETTPVIETNVETQENGVQSAITEQKKESNKAEASIDSLDANVDETTVKDSEPESTSVSEETIEPKGEIIDENQTAGTQSDAVDSEKIHDEPPEDEGLTDNFYAVAVAQMKEKGELPPDFELGEDSESHPQNIYDAYHDLLQKDVNTELFKSFQDEIAKRGWDNETLKTASLLNSGVTAQEITKAVDYKRMSSANISEMTDEEKLGYIEQMYEDKGFGAKDIKRAINGLEIDGDYDGVAEEAVAYFGERAKEQDSQNVMRAQQIEQYKTQVAQYNQSVISELFNKKEIGGEKLTEDQLDLLDDALHQRTVPVQHEGKVYNLTPYEQFEASLESFPMRLYLFKKWLFKDSEMQSMRDAALREAENSQIKKWGRKVSKVESKTDQRDNTKQTALNRAIEVPEGSTSYIMEQDGFKQI